VSSKLQRQINDICWASNIRSPVMLIDRIFLIHIDLEELVVGFTLEVLVGVQLFEVGLNQILFDYFDELIVPTLGRDEVSLTLKRAIVDLPDKLYGVRRLEREQVDAFGAVSDRWRRSRGKLGPGHECFELLFVKEALRAIRLHRAATEQGGHSEGS
jgi:hypothetical protein